MREKAVTVSFRRAVEDYRLLVEKTYARTSALKLVGDRYQLTAVQRSMLYRGITSAVEASSRAAKRTDTVAGLTLHIDALNVLYTVANYLYGRALFIATDGWLRDTGEAHGNGNAGLSVKRTSTIETAAAIVVDWLAEQRPSEIAFYVDEPVSLSGRLAARLRANLREAGLVGSAGTVRSADFVLKRAPTGVVATSDSAIIDHSSCRVCDIAYHVLMKRFSPELIDLRKLVGGGGLPPENYRRRHDR
jgi:hypothetical protein